MNARAHNLADIMAEFKQSGRNYIVDIEIKVMLTI